MTTMCMLGIVRPRNLGLIAFCGSFVGAGGCLTDFDYLRAGNNASGAGGEEPPDTSGTGTGTGGPSADAGDANDSNVGDSGDDAFDAADLGREVGPRRVPTGVVTGVSYPTMQLSPSAGG